jgi:hypothetical protein
MNKGKVPQMQALEQGGIMDFLRRLSVDQVVEAFRRDHKVLKESSQWPSTPFERLNLLRKAERPVDNILSLAWSLYAVGRDEVLRKVRPVWIPDNASSLGEMVAAMQAGTFKLPEPNSVGKLEAAMTVQFRESDFLLVGYLDGSGSILLEDGHNRVTAAACGGVLPATVRMYLGEGPSR